MPAPTPDREIARTAAFEFGALPFNHGDNPSVTSPGTSDAVPTLLGEPGLPSSPDLGAAGVTAHDVAALASPSSLAPAPPTEGSLTAEQSPVSAQGELSAAAMQRLATAATATSPTATALLTALPMPSPLAPAAPQPARDPLAAARVSPAAASAPDAATHPVASAPIPLSRPAVNTGPADTDVAPAPAVALGKSVAKAEPAKANLAKPAPKAQATPGDAAPPKAGGFRETAWFMDALAAENLSEIEEKDISERAAKFDDVNDIDEAQGRQFSLRSGTGPKLDTDQVDAARAKAKGLTATAPANATDDAADRAELDAVPASSSPMLYILLALVVLGGLGATAWYLFFRG